MVFSRQEYWSGLPCSPPGDLSDPEIESVSPACRQPKYYYESESPSVVLDSLDPTDYTFSPWNSPGQNTGVGSLFLLQGIFPTQGSNPGLPHCRQILHQLSHKGGPNITIRSDQFSRSVMSDSLRPHESQHARPSCPSPTPGGH